MQENHSSLELNNSYLLNRSYWDTYRVLYLKYLDIEGKFNVQKLSPEAFSNRKQNLRTDGFYELEVELTEGRGPFFTH